MMKLVVAVLFLVLGEAGAQSCGDAHSAVNSVQLSAFIGGGDLPLPLPFSSTTCNYKAIIPPTNHMIKVTVVPAFIGSPQPGEVVTALAINGTVVPPLVLGCTLLQASSATHSSNCW